MAKYITQLTLENFQSHQYTEVNLDPEFNVIVGASDQGKSAIIRGIRWLLFNEPRGSDFIRAGATACRVTAVFNDGISLTRERTPSKNRYILRLPGAEEQIFEGFNNQVPMEIIQAHGITKVLLDEDTEAVLNLGTQLEGPFLLSSNGAVKAKAIGRISGVHVIDAAQRDTTRDLLKLQQEERQLLDALKAVEEQLQTFSDLPKLAQIISLITDKLEQVQQHKARLERLQQLAQRQQQVDHQLSVVQHFLGRTEQVEAAAQQLNHLEQTVGRWNYYNNLRHKYLELTKTLALCEDSLLATAQLAKAEVDLQILHSLQNSCNNLMRFRTMFQNLQRETMATQTTLDKTEEVHNGLVAIDHLTKEVDRVSRLKLLIRQKDDLQQQMAEVDQLLGLSSQINQGNETLIVVEQLQNKLLSLQQKATQLQETSGRLVKGEEYLLGLNKEMSRLLEVYQRTLEELGRCPLCLGTINQQCLANIKAEYQGG